MGVKRLEKNS